jgi:polyisoprenoid-binding protein YceI
MNRINMKTVLLLLGATALFAVSVPAADSIRYKARPLGSKVTIDGTANVHNWTMAGELIGGFMEVPAGVEFDQNKTALTGVTDGKLDARGEVSIPVTSLKGNWSGMDEPMQDAMNAATHPAIHFHLTGLTCKDPHAAGAPFQFDAKGDLSFNGVTNVISMPASIENVESGKLKIVGKVPLKMTDFKVKPPVKAGLFITGDEVVISFEWLVAVPKTAAAK